MRMVTRSTEVSVRIGPLPNSKSLKRRMSWSDRIINAGPATNADTRKRGARIALFQNGRPPRPEYRNAVTVWIEMAHTIDRNTKGIYQRLSGFSPRNFL